MLAAPRASRPGAALVLQSALALLGGGGGCSKANKTSLDGGAPTGGSIVSAPSATAPGAPRSGMEWIASGILKGGTPVDQIPRIAGEELPWTDIALGGFYMDVLPWPNEAGAIPMSNVSRDEASRLCASKDKRLCTELEWERACKGPSNTLYEYGDAYNPAACGTGVTSEEGARQPSGQRSACKSVFGVRDMHGGVWEWTDSAWGRGSARELGVLRGGNAVAGELVARCANARAQPAATKSPTAGFRCCAGPRNDATVELKIAMGEALRKADKVDDLPQAVALGCGAPGDEGACTQQRAWAWRPAANVELFVKGGCRTGQPVQRCGILVGRVVGDRVQTLLTADSGREPPEVVLVAGEGRRIRLKGFNEREPFFKEIFYSYGRLDSRDVKAK